VKPASFVQAPSDLAPAKKRSAKSEPHTRGTVITAGTRAGPGFATIADNAFGNSGMTPLDEPIERIPPVRLLRRPKAEAVTLA
jgi:hypothetical protein